MSTSCPHPMRPVIWSRTNVWETEGKYVLTTAMRIKLLFCRTRAAQYKCFARILSSLRAQVLERCDHVAQRGPTRPAEYEDAEEDNDGDAETDDQSDELVRRMREMVEHEHGAAGNDRGNGERCAGPIEIERAHG